MAVGDGRVISNFVVSALRDEPLTIYGDGRQTRSFCYVNDLMDGLLRLMTYDGPDAHEPVNLGNPNENAIAELVGEIEHCLGRPLRTTREPLPQDDPKRRCPNIARARERLGWSPGVTLRDGLRETIEYFKSVL